MTSQKSLNNVNKNDFKRSFLGALPFPVIAFLVLFTMVTIPVISYVTSEEFVRTTEHLEVSMFLAPHSTFFYSFDLLPVGMVFCGILTALKSFYFMLSKKQVNVFLSLGIKRNTMVTNRLISGVVALFVAVFLPIFIIYITNIAAFGYNSHQTSLFLYFTSLLFVCGLIGYSLISAMIVVSGNIFEAVGSSIALSLIPFCTISTISSLAYSYLNGYIGSYDISRVMQVFTPWTMAINMQEEYVYMGDIYDYVDRITPRVILNMLQRTVPADKYKVPAEYHVDWGFMFPVVMWLVISVVLIGVTYYLFNKRKAEHANSLGKFPVSRAVLGTCAFTGITWVFTEWFGGEFNLYALFVVITAVCLLAYFLIQLILTRKPKTAIKSLKWCYALIGAFAVCCIVFNTGLLGTYNKIPDKADVKSVTIEAFEIRGYEHCVYPWQPGEDFVESSTDESKQTVLDAFELLKNEKGKHDEECLTSITLGIRNNDGKIKYRNFDIYSDETYMKYIQLIYGSEYFDAILKNYLIDPVPENIQYDSTGHLKNFNWAYTDNDMLIEIGEGMDCIADVDGLCEALYKDLSKMSVDELFRNNNQPVGVLVKMSADADYPGQTPAYTNEMYYPENTRGGMEIIVDKIVEEPDYNHALVDDFIPVYENMTNTVNFLKKNGYELKEEPMKIKEVLYSDATMSLPEAKHEFAKANEKNNRGWGSATEMLPLYVQTMFRQLDVSLYACDVVQYFIDEPTTEYDLIKRVYKDAGHSLESVTDAEKIQKIVDKTTSQYLTLNDNGRYVYVIYEEGPIVCYYLPEANMSVIK